LQTCKVQAATSYMLHVFSSPNECCLVFAIGSFPFFDRWAYMRTRIHT
jgi:hypothetical protein